VVSVLHRKDPRAAPRSGSRDSRLPWSISMTMSSVPSQRGCWAMYGTSPLREPFGAGVRPDLGDRCEVRRVIAVIYSERRTCKSTRLHASQQESGQHAYFVSLIFGAVASAYSHIYVILSVRCVSSQLVDMYRLRPHSPQRCLRVWSACRVYT